MRANVLFFLVLFIVGQAGFFYSQERYYMPNDPRAPLGDTNRYINPADTRALTSDLNKYYNPINPPVESVAKTIKNYYTTIITGGDGNYSDTNVYNLLSFLFPIGDANISSLSWSKIIGVPAFLTHSIFPITDANLFIPNVWASIDGNKGVGFVDLNGYMKQGNFDSNIAGRMPIKDANLNVPNVWSAIDGNKVYADLNGYLNEFKFDSNLMAQKPAFFSDLSVTGILKVLSESITMNVAENAGIGMNTFGLTLYDLNTAGYYLGDPNRDGQISIGEIAMRNLPNNFTESQGFLVPLTDSNLKLTNVWSSIDGNRSVADLNGYMKQGNFDSNIAGRMPISDNNLSVPNVWSAIDGNKTLTDLNGYINKAKFDENFAVAFDINFVSRFDGNFNSRFKTQYDNNATQRQSDTNKMIQQALDRNNFYRQSDANTVLMKKADMNTQYYTQIDANKVLVKQNAFPLVDANISSAATWNAKANSGDWLGANTFTGKQTITYPTSENDSSIDISPTYNASFDWDVYGIRANGSYTNGIWGSNLIGYIFNPSGTMNSTIGYFCDTSSISGGQEWCFKGNADIELTSGQFRGSGAGLTSVPDSALTSNIPKLNASNIFTGTKNSFIDVNARDINASRDLNIWGKFRVFGTSIFTGTITAGTISGGAISGSSLSSSGNISSTGGGTIGTAGAINAGTSMSSGGNIDAASYSANSIQGLDVIVVISTYTGDCYLTFTSGLLTATTDCSTLP